MASGNVNRKRGLGGLLEISAPEPEAEGLCEYGPTDMDVDERPMTRQKVQDDSEWTEVTSRGVTETSDTLMLESDVASVDEGRSVSSDSEDEFFYSERFDELVRSQFIYEFDTHLEVWTSVQYCDYSTYDEYIVDLPEARGAK